MAGDWRWQRRAVRWLVRERLEPGITVNAKVRSRQGARGEAKVSVPHRLSWSGRKPVHMLLVRMRRWDAHSGDGRRSVRSCHEVAG
jgi:hypothetical protein